MKTSDGDRKVNQNIQRDVVTCDRMWLIGPKCDQLGPITIVYLKSPSEKNVLVLFLSTQDWVLSLACPMIRKLSSV